MGRNIESVYAVGHGQGEGLDIRKDDDHFPRYAQNITLWASIDTPTFLSVGEVFRKLSRSETLNSPSVRNNRSNVVRFGKTKWFKYWDLPEIKTNRPTWPNHRA